jgi:hypothetical protein
MTKSFYCLWFFVIIFQYCQTQFIGDDWPDPLTLDQAYLNISNNNYPYSITVKHNLVVCEKCDFEILVEGVKQSSSHTVIINTKYAHDFKIILESSNETLLCEIDSYTFSDRGFYLFEIIKTPDNHSSCSITPIDEPEWYHYWLPPIIGLIILIIFIIFTQIWHRISQSERLSRLLPTVVQEGLITNEFTLSISRTPNMIANDPNVHNDDIINTLRSDNDVTSSTRILTNSISRTKSLPKRLCSLDAFRGFSLMVMIFVNYGG